VLFSCGNSLCVELRFNIFIFGSAVMLCCLIHSVLVVLCLDQVFAFETEFIHMQFLFRKILALKTDSVFDGTPLAKGPITRSMAKKIQEELATSSQGEANSFSWSIFRPFIKGRVE